MTFWSRVKDKLRPVAEARPATAPGPTMPPEELHLRTLLDRVCSPATEIATAARASLDGDEVQNAIDQLLSADRARTAIELARRILSFSPGAFRLAMRLVEILCDRLEHAEAVPYLEALLCHPAFGPRARFLLAEAAERAGDLEGARRHYELLLATDIDHPKARARWLRLRPERAVLAAAPTIAGLSGEGEQARVGDRYRLRRELGRGAAGAVYLALDEELGLDVALKLLHPHATRRAATARLHAWNEARIAAALRHPGVVAIYDLDEERGLIAMELCGGGTLRDRLSRGRLQAGEALRRARELFATLDAVHKAGVLHRDLKPGNLLFRDPLPLDGEEADLVLGDFGLANLVGEAPATAAAGTLGYVAPEARRGETLPASDVHAAGVILFEMLSGALPFDRAAILRGDTRFEGTLPEAAAASLGPTRSAALSKLLEHLLAADPAARPTSSDAASALLELSMD